MIGESELQQIEKNIKNKEGVKLNIHVVLGEDAVKQVKKINNEICESVGSDIVFCNSLMQPHITLVMGVLKNVEDIEKLKIVISNELSKLKIRMVVQFDKITITQNGKWAMLWLKENQELSNLVSVLKQKLSNIMDISTFDAPHVTLAKGEQISQFKNVAGLKIPQSFIVTNIGVGLAGKNGTVLKRISMFQICEEQKK